MIAATDIAYVLSGGSMNINPLRSLGGYPSVTLVTSKFFPDIKDADTKAGLTDFRCIYIANDNNTDTLYNCRTYIANEAISPVSVQFGFNFQNDIQQVIIDNGTSVTSGSFTLLYENTNFIVPFGAGTTAWASNFQAAVRTITNLKDITVVGSVNVNKVIFQVNFIGGAGSRFHAILQVVDNSLIPTANILITKIFNGAPINSIAPETDSIKTTPTGILFSSPILDAPLAIGDLRPTDILPVWIKRICPIHTAPLANDGFDFQFVGDPLPPS